ncbi:MAG: MBL fold metallo-hydrolase [Roseiflexaceae bacterium]
MRITNHGSFLVQLTLWPQLFPINMYMVREDDGLTLIDAGMPGQGRAILAAAASLGGALRRVVLTHAHADHIGSADELVQAIPEVELIVSVRDARFLRGDMSLDPHEPQVPLKGAYGKIQSVPKWLVQDGDRIGSLMVVAAAGHTPGQVALFDTRDQSLVAGDSFQTRAGLAVSGMMRWLFPFPAMATWHRPTALATAKRLRALNPTRLGVGHGDMLEQPNQALDRAIAEAERALI